MASVIWSGTARTPRTVQRETSRRSSAAVNIVGVAHRHIENVAVFLDRQHIVAFRDMFGNDVQGALIRLVDGEVYKRLAEFCRLGFVDMRGIEAQVYEDLGEVAFCGLLRFFCVLDLLCRSVTFFYQIVAKAFCVCPGWDLQVSGTGIVILQGSGLLREFWSGLRPVSPEYAPAKSFCPLRIKP